MECPACNHLNTATAVRCIQCRTTLIHEAVGHSSVYQTTVSSMDARMYGGVGAVFGFFVVGGLLKFIFASASISDREIYVFSLGGAFAGAFLGRLLLRSKRGSL